MIYRLAQRDCHCRGCDKTLKRDVDSGVFMHSMRNRGQNIMLCNDCIEKVYGLMVKYHHDKD